MPTTTTPNQTPTQTPTQDGKKIILRQYADVIPVTVGTQEIIAKALAGQYQKGDRVEGVSAIYEGKGVYREGDHEGIFVYFGPAYQGFYIGIWLEEHLLGFAKLEKGDTVVFDGEYYTTAKNVPYSQGLNVIFLDDTRLFLIKR